jgi:hypothetical protein
MLWPRVLGKDGCYLHVTLSFFSKRRPTFINILDSRKAMRDPTAAGSANSARVSSDMSADTASLENGNDILRREVRGEKDIEVSSVELYDKEDIPEKVGIASSTLRSLGMRAPYPPAAPHSCSPLSQTPRRLPLRDLLANPRHHPLQHHCLRGRPSKTRLCSSLPSASPSGPAQPSPP